MGAATGATLIAVLVPGEQMISGNGPISRGTGFEDALASLGIAISQCGATMPSLLTAKLVGGDGQGMPRTQTIGALTQIDMSDSQRSAGSAIGTATAGVALPDGIVPSVSPSVATTRVMLPESASSSIAKMRGDMTVVEDIGSGSAMPQPQLLIELAIPVPADESLDVPEFLRRVNAALADVLGSGSVQLIEPSASAELANVRLSAKSGTSRDGNLTENAVAQPTRDCPERAIPEKSPASSTERMVVNESETTSPRPGILFSEEQTSTAPPREAQVPETHTRRVAVPVVNGTQSDRTPAVFDTVESEGPASTESNRMSEEEPQRRVVVNRTHAERAMSGETATDGRSTQRHSITESTDLPAERNGDTHTEAAAREPAPAEFVRRPEHSSAVDVSRQVAAPLEQAPDVVPLAEMRPGSELGSTSVARSRPIEPPSTLEPSGLQALPTHRVSVPGNDVTSSEMLGNARMQSAQDFRSTPDTAHRTISQNVAEPAPAGKRAMFSRAGVVQTQEKALRVDQLSGPQLNDGAVEVRRATPTGPRPSAEVAVQRVETTHFAAAPHRPAGVTIVTPASAENAGSPMSPAEPRRADVDGPQDLPMQMGSDRERQGENRRQPDGATTRRPAPSEPASVAMNAPTHTSIPSVGQVVPTSNDTAAITQGRSVGPADAPHAAVPPEESAGPRTEWVTVRMEDGGDGAARLRVAVRGELVHTTIVHDDPAVAQALREKSGELRQALERQGFTDSRVSVNGKESLPRGDATSTPNRGDADPRNSDDAGRRDRERDLSERREDKPFDSPDDRERSGQRRRGNRKGRD